MSAVANTDPAWGELRDAADAVFEIGARKGLWFVTDPATKSDFLTAVIVPPEAFNRLGRALGRIPQKEES